MKWTMATALRASPHHETKNGSSDPMCLRNIARASTKTLVRSLYLQDECGPRRRSAGRMVKLMMVKSFPPSIRLLATDIDGTLLNPQFQISEGDLAALRRAHAAGIEIILVTGRRHTFALPIAQQLGFDLWLISSNGAVTRSLSGETFHRDLMPAEICRQLCEAMILFRGNTVLTFDKEVKGAIVLEHLDEIGASIRRWLEKNMEFIEFVVPIEGAL